MRKIVVFLLGVMVFALSSVTLAMGNYPMYLGGNKNYIFCDVRTGVATYLDRSSLNVQKYAPPEYIIAANFITVQPAKFREDSSAPEHPMYINGELCGLYGPNTLRFKYDWDSRKMYVENTSRIVEDDNREWGFVPRPGQGLPYEVNIAREGEMLFYSAYHMRFYNCLNEDDYVRLDS